MFKNLKLIKPNFSSYSKLASILLIAYVIIFFLKSPTYTSQVTFYATYKDKQNTSALLSPLSGLMGVNKISLEFSVSDYIKSDKMLQSVVEKEYNIEGERLNLIEYWNKDFDKFQINPLKAILRINQNLKFHSSLSDFDKKTFLAKETLIEKIDFSENRISSLYTISVKTAKHPSLSKDILDQVYSSVIAYANEIQNSKASEKIDFINERLDQVSSDLLKAENEKLNFLENNKSLSSPLLTLKIERIQRKIDLHSNVYTNLSNQLEIAKIDQKDNTSSIFLLDKPKIASNRDGNSLLMGLLKIIIFSFIFYFGFFIIKNIYEEQI